MRPLVVGSNIASTLVVTLKLDFDVGKLFPNHSQHQTQA